MKTNELTIPVKVDEVKLVYQTKTPASQRAKVTCSEDAYNAFLNSWEEGTLEHHESFRILLLSRTNRALGGKTGQPDPLSPVEPDHWKPGSIDSLISFL